ncbi:NAD(P)/FAD-dependent oxidoreductase [Sediminibacterium soli]|uniref:NAD(P)/FAD-dependent oxidoreductase n=1 Tax=Sediminibacterium soli TaxID=2698829 RepID=UPI00137B4E4C|nr:FAD-dependent oxidoreductase [Sediminibacterium soli]NCI46784.1 FAD-dependent oxidoreductase [Sediminibacterium soli]
MKAVIIGGGIIGLSTAYYLVRDGWEVTVVDRSDLSDNCSYGNLGMIVPSHFVPLAAPGIVSQGLRWMFSSSSPFYVKPSLNAQLVGWGWKFLRSANAKNVAASAPHLKAINLLSKQLYEDMAKEPGFEFGLEKKGIMMYFKTEKVAEEEIHMAETARSMGLDAVALTAAEARALEPDMDLDVLGAVHYRCDAHLYPNKLMEQMQLWLKWKGVQFVTGSEVRQVYSRANRITGIQTGSAGIAGDVFVFAAGSWMPQLLKLAALQLPLMPGKGYSFMQQPARQLNIPAILCEARVAITPMGNSVRFGGTMEIAPVNSQVNMNRVKGIVDSVPAYLPGLAVQMPEKDKIWYGFRPCSPDGVPYIGYGARYENLLYGAGHAMMGLSLGPATGLLLSELASRRKTSIDVHAFDPARFD